MARIRSIKPDFFRDETLQDLESANPGKHCMLVFAGLWTQSDKSGNFPWNSRVLHLDILPFIEFDLGASLVLLSEAGLISRYAGDDGREYGSVCNFAKHQRISGKELQEPSKYPQKIQGSNGEAPEKHPVVLGREGKGLLGKEGKGELVNLAPELFVKQTVTEESFTIDAAVSYFLCETGLAGRRIREVVHEVITRDVNHLGVKPKDTAEAMIDACRRYEKADVEFRKSPENFIASGDWRKTEAEWMRKKVKKLVKMVNPNDIKREQREAAEREELDRSL